MKKFRFRLESVLKVRMLREEEALKVLGEAQRRYQDELKEKARLQAELSRAFESREKLGAAPATSREFALAHDFIAGGKHRLLRQEQAIFRAQKGVEKALRSFLQARRQTRMIELLREKDYVEFKRVRARLEQKRIDELVSTRQLHDFTIKSV